MATLLAQLPEAQAVALMGFDGLPVMVRHAGPLGDALAAALTEYAQALVALRRGGRESLHLGGAPTDLIVHGPQATVLLRPLHDDYFLAVVQAPQAPVGRARFFVDLALPALLAEL